MLKKLDIYIVKKYISTFFFVGFIFTLIAVVIDFSEKMNDFIDEEVPFDVLMLDYYIHFIPYIAALLAPVFVFLAVILFTSKLAGQSEIIAMLGNGISFYRLLRPYLIGGLLITAMLVYANNWLVPKANKERIAFEQEYILYQVQNYLKVNMTIDKNDDGETQVMLHRYNFDTREGFQFSLEKIKDNRLVQHIRSPRVEWLPEEGQWRIYDYEIWEMDGMEQNFAEGSEMDMSLKFSPNDFVTRIQIKETMDYGELNKFIDRERMVGSTRLPHYLVEKHSRTANAFATLVLTFIGVSLSSRKKRGGLGINIAFGFLISITFIIFLRFSTTFATNANLPALIATWIPNVIFGIVAFFLVKFAPK